MCLVTGRKPKGVLDRFYPLFKSLVVDYQLVTQGVEEQRVPRQAIKAPGKQLVQGPDIVQGLFLQHQSHCLSHDSLFLMCHLLTGITGEIMIDLCLKGLLASNLGAVMCHNGFFERNYSF